MVLCIFSVILTLVFMIPQFTKMKNSPFITSVETTNHPIWNIDFPAVTICSNNKVMDKQLRKEVGNEPWNKTHLYEANDTKHERSYEAVKGVLERYVFFAEDESTFNRNTTEDEEYVIRNQSRAIPSTLRKVLIKPL